jgi:hypothetical protein
MAEAGNGSPGGIGTEKVSVRSRLEERQAAYEEEFGEIEARHRDDLKMVRYASVVWAAICGVAIGLWWHPVIAFCMGIGCWGAAKEPARKCEADAARRTLYGVE